MKGSVQVRILPYDLRIDCNIGSKLIDVINNSNTNIENICGGVGKCGKCKVRVISGELSELSEKEKKLLSQYEMDDNIVLACEREVEEDITIEIINMKKESLCKGKTIRNRSNSNKDRKVEQEYNFETISPLVIKKHINLPLPTLTDQRSDIKRILEEVSREIYHEEIIKNELINKTISKETSNEEKKEMIFKKRYNFKFDINLIKNLGQVLQKSNYDITVGIFDKEVISIEGGNREEENYAIAIDL